MHLKSRQLLYHHEVTSEYVHNKNVDTKFSAHRILQYITTISEIHLVCSTWVDLTVS